MTMEAYGSRAPSADRANGILATDRWPTPSTRGNGPVRKRTGSAPRRVRRSRARALMTAASVCALAAALVAPSSAAGSEFFDYTVIATAGESSATSDFHGIGPSYALNNEGEVAFLAIRHGDLANVVYRSDGNGLTPVFEPATATDYPRITDQFRGVGLNDAGTVAFSVSDIIDGFSARSVWIEQEGSIERITDWISHMATNAAINADGQVAYCTGDSFDSTLWTTDGDTTRALGGGCWGRWEATISDSGAAAQLAMVDDIGDIFDDAIVRLYEPDQQQRTLLVLPDTTWSDVGESWGPGINADDWVSGAFGVFTGEPRGVVLVSPESTIAEPRAFIVADDSGPFDVFFGATSLNDWNQVAFTPRHDDSAAIGLYIGTATGDPPLPVIALGDTIAGEPATLSNLNLLLTPGALNEQGQVAFIADIGGVFSLVRADPKPGVTPGNPILPDPDQMLPPPPDLGGDPGWRLPVEACLRRDLDRCFIDPDYAEGYDYWTGTGERLIESVLIPVPLPEGDAEFTVHFDGFELPLTAGEPFYFTDHVPEGVGVFGIRGIDAAEMLNPGDPQAFVTGLTFVANTPETTEIGMRPFVPGDAGLCVGDDTFGDADGDGLCDDGINDLCPFDPDNDADADGICAFDADGALDNCPADGNPAQTDTDGDLVGDVCDADDDGDGVDDTADNCPLVPNADQADFDNDGQGDACDADIDGDGLNDAVDQCLGTAPGVVTDFDGCSIAQRCPCNNEWKNHGAYSRCVAHTSEDFVDLGLITEAEKDAIVSEAGESECGHKK